MSSSGERIGRLCWFSYHIAIFPACLFCGIIVIPIVKGFSETPRRVIEPDLASSAWSALLTSSIFVLPALWIFGLFLAHRFNGRWLPTVPFILHLIPVSILTVWAGFAVLKEPEMFVIFCCLLVPSILLLAGLVTVVITGIGAKEEKGKGQDWNLNGF